MSYFISSSFKLQACARAHTHSYNTIVSTQLTSCVSEGWRWAKSGNIILRVRGEGMIYWEIKKKWKLIKKLRIYLALYLLWIKLFVKRQYRLIKTTRQLPGDFTSSTFPPVDKLKAFVLLDKNWCVCLSSNLRLPLKTTRRCFEAIPYLVTLNWICTYLRTL